MKKNKEIDKFNPIIRKLEYEDYNILQNFCAGKTNFAFTNFIKNSAKDDMQNGDGVTYLVIDEINDYKKDLVAYYTISTGSMNFIDRYDFDDDEIPEAERREHYSPISAFYINMFAVNEKYQDTLYEGKLISGLILKNIIHELINLSTDVIGAKVITLCSVKEAVDFYKTNGKFEELTDEYTLMDKVDLNDTIPMKSVIHKI